MAAALAATALTATNANAATTVDFKLGTEFAGTNVPGSPTSATISGQLDYDQLLSQTSTAVSSFTVLIDGNPFTDFPSGVSAIYTGLTGSTGTLNFTSGSDTVFSFNLTNLFSANGRPPAGATTTTNETSFTYSTNTPVTINAGLNGSLAVTDVAAAAPEPATWLLMLVGFGAVGYGLRRRKAAVSRVGYSFA